MLVAVVLAVRAVAFQPVRKVIRQQRVVWVSLRGWGQSVGERGLGAGRVVVLVSRGKSGALEVLGGVSFVEGIGGVPSEAIVGGR